MSLGVIVIGYNRPEKIGRLLESLKNYTDYFGEILICLDYHSEEARKKHILELSPYREDNKYTFHYHTKNLGLKENLFTAYDYLKCRHEFLMFLEDDLEIKPNLDKYLVTVLAKLSSNQISSASLYSYPDKQ